MGHTAFLCPYCLQPCCNPSNLIAHFTAPKDKWRIPTYGQPVIYNGLPRRVALKLQGTQEHPYFVEAAVLKSDNLLSVTLLLHLTQSGERLA